MIQSPDYLLQYGFDPVNESLFLDRLEPEKRTTTLKHNLDSYVSEILLDEPVSLIYHYWISSQDEIYTDPSQKEIYNLAYQISPDERGGLYLPGIKKAIHAARLSPYHLIGLYSPPGPAGFDNNPDNPFAKIEYTYGQLYLMYWDSEAIHALALKTNGVGDIWAQNLIEFASSHHSKQSFGHSSLTDGGEKSQKIASTIQTPIYFGPIDEIFTEKTQLGTYNHDFVIYTKHNGKQILFSEAWDITADTFFNRRQSSDFSFDWSLDLINKYHWTREMVEKAYLSAMYSYASQAGQEKLVLSGSCGGSIAEVTEIEKLLGIDQSGIINSFDQLVNIFGSDYRKLSQSEGSYGFDQEASCIVCHTATKVGPCKICRSCDQKIRVRESAKSS